jgi:hypothetical protein
MPPVSNKVKNTKFHNHFTEILANVLKFMEKEAQKDLLTSNLKNVQRIFSKNCKQNRKRTDGRQIICHT